MSETASAQRKRFRKWQNLAHARTRFLSTQVETTLAAWFEQQGFLRVDLNLSDPQWPVRGSEIVLERVVGEQVDVVTFNFDKYRTPRFQLHAQRRVQAPPHEFVRSCNLVARRSQYYHFWGKPWWLPTRFWSDSGSLRTIGQVSPRLEQLVRFLEHGEIGPNISRGAHRPA